MRKHNGKQQEKAMKLWKRNIDGITVIITQKTKGAGFNNSVCT